MNSTQGATVLGYRDYRYLKATAAPMALAVVAYALTDDASGGTVLGYVLGTAATLLVLVLMAYGVVRRRIGAQAVRVSAVRKKARAEAGTLQGWLSAHLYLGGLLVVLATLHSGFYFGWNVHTLSYVLMLLVVGSGLYGLNAYLHYPTLITLNMGDDSPDDLMLKLAEIDELTAARAHDMPAAIQTLVAGACRETRVGGNLFQQLQGDQRDCPTRFAALQLPLLGAGCAQPEAVRDLYVLLLRKEKLLQRARTDVMLKARMMCWLWLHAPLGIALLAALAAHILSIFFYW